MADRVGAIFAPAHARQLEALTDHRLAGRLHRPRTDVPAPRPVRRVIHEMHVVADLTHRLRIGLPGRPPPAAAPAVATPGGWPRRPGASWCGTRPTPEPCCAPRPWGTTPAPALPGSWRRGRNPESPPRRGG